MITLYTPWYLLWGIVLGTHRIGCWGGIAYYSSLHKNLFTWHMLQGRLWLKQLGPKESFVELQFSSFLSFAWGTQDSSFFIFPIRIAPQKNALRIHIYYYLDSRKTSQWSAAFGYRYHRHLVLTENDAFTFSAEDKFRTGAVGYYFYSDQGWQWHAKLLLWTGDPKGAPVYQDSLYKSRFGYKDLSQQPYGRYSHGILALGFYYPQWYGLYISMGLDAEQIRHWTQNRLIHDAYFIPRKWLKARNPHYPMLNRAGLPVIRPNDKPRPARWFGEIGLYPLLLY